MQSECSLFIRLDADYFKFPTNVNLVCAYIPPEGSVFCEANEENCIELLKSKMYEIASANPNDAW